MGRGVSRAEDRSTRLQQELVAPDPVVERLPVVLSQVGPAFFHLDQHDRLIDQVGEGGAPFVALLDPHFQRGARFLDPFQVEGHEEAVLRGARRLLLRDRPSLIIEIEERHRRHAVGAVSGFLAELGYRGFFFRHGRLNPIETFRAEEHQDVSRMTGGGVNGDDYVNNFLFPSHETLAKLQHLIVRPPR